jgi:toxin ParE1/3/4
LIPVRVEPEAREEIREAARWYEDRERGLSQRLLDEIETALGAIEQMPRRFARVTDVDVDVEVRRALLRRFPYAIVFVIAPTVIAVIAVMHVKRKPGYWLYRLDSLDED